MRPIRNSAKAVIIQDDKLLCTRNEDQWGFFYLLPGGGQDPGETLMEALRRECREEIGAEITIRDLRYIREYIGKNHQFAEWDAELHQVEFMFLCDLKPESPVRNGANPDNWQVGVEWLPLDKLKEYRIYPSVLATFLGPGGQVNGPVYLGDTN